jgi:hypothetical protein
VADDVHRSLAAPTGRAIGLLLKIVASSRISPLAFYHWSQREIADEAMRRGLVRSISQRPEQICADRAASPATLPPATMIEHYRLGLVSIHNIGWKMLPEEFPAVDSVAAFHAWFSVFKPRVNGQPDSIALKAKQTRTKFASRAR